LQESDAYELTAAEKPLQPRSVRVVKVVFRIGVGAALIGFLAWRGDVRSIGEALARVRPSYVALAVILMLFVLIVSTFRWQIFLQELRLALPVGALLRLYFVGTFFNAFLPTGVGGDAYKAIRLGRGSRSLAHAFASVILDRFAGILGLASIGLVAVGARLADGDSSGVVGLAAALAVGIFVVTALLIVRGDRLLGGGSSTWFGVRPKLRRLLAAMADVGRKPRAVRWALLGGVIAQSFVLAAHISLAEALALNVPTAALAALLVVATVAATAPVTINGLGIREAAWVWGLGIYGVDSGQAVAYAILVLGVSLATSALGGAVYVIAGAEISKS
jgi:glycosyltransferase 2 family protein